MSSEPVLKEGIAGFWTVGGDGVSTALHSDEAEAIVVSNHASDVLVEEPRSEVVCDGSLEAANPMFSAHERDSSISITRDNHDGPLGCFGEEFGEEKRDVLLSAEGSFIVLPARSIARPSPLLGSVRIHIESFEHISTVHVLGGPVIDARVIHEGVQSMPFT